MSPDLGADGGIRTRTRVAPQRFLSSRPYVQDSLPESTIHGFMPIFVQLRLSPSTIVYGHCCQFAVSRLYVVRRKPVGPFEENLPQLLSPITLLGPMGRH